MIVLYGNSLFIAGMRAGLSNKESMKVVQITSTCTDIEEMLNQLRPNAIIMETVDAQAELVFTLLKKYPGLPVICLDISSNSVHVLHSQYCIASTVNQLVHVIQEYTDRALNLLSGQHTMRQLVADGSA
ncbi:MAG: hypothetical protein HC837_10510 [Chloroflexaceae bacterium]|nr:hypothetical protein [Chloroflexaceae bacterium]